MRYKQIKQVLSCHMTAPPAARPPAHRRLPAARVSARAASSCHVVPSRSSNWLTMTAARVTCVDRRFEQQCSGRVGKLLRSAPTPPWHSAPAH